MRGPIRAGLGVIALAWVVAVPVWTVWARLPRTVQAERVPAARWERAVGRPARLPISWHPGQGAPPLLPARGQLILRRDEAVLDGLALIPGTGQLDRLEVTIGFHAESFERYRRLEGPLIPFLGDHRPKWIQAAKGVDLSWGLDDPSTADEQGLRLRWDRAVAVQWAGADKPLFPGRERTLTAGARDGRSTIRLLLDGNHVLASVNDELMFDFHTTRRLPGAVGVETHDGVITLLGIDVREPEPPES